MTRRHGLAVLALLAVCVAAFVALRSGSEHAHERVGGTGNAPSAGDPAAMLEGSNDEEQPAADGPLPPPDGPPPIQADDSPRPPAFASGTVRYEDGAEPDAFTFLLRRRSGPQAGSGWAIRGVNGTFEVPHLRPGPYDVVKMVADGAEAPVVGSELQLEKGATYNILIRRNPRVALVVRDEQTGTLLSDAYAYRDRGSLRIGPIEAGAEFWIPGAATLRFDAHRADGNGEILIPTRARAAPWLVGAPGRMWRRVIVPVLAEEPIEVRLAPGGTVVLRIPNWHDVEKPVLLTDFRDKLPAKIHVFGGGPVPDKDGALRIDGLPEGFITFGVGRRGSFIEITKLYGEGRVEIRRGAEAYLELPLEAGPPARTAVLRGSIEIHKGWLEGTSGQWRLLLRGAYGDPQTAGQAAEARLSPVGTAVPTSFETDPLPEGKYLLKLRPLSWTTVVELRRDTDEYAIVVPPPIEVRVRMVDERTGATVRATTLRYSPVVDGQSTYSWKRADLDRETTEYVLRVPAGGLQLLASAPGYQELMKTVEAQALDVASFELKLARGGALRIILVHDGKPVSARGIGMNVSRDGRSRGLTGRGDEALVEGLEPAEWTVKLRKIAGYRIPPPQAATVMAGETTTVTFDLERDDG